LLGLDAMMDIRSNVSMHKPTQKSKADNTVSVQFLLDVWQGATGYYHFDCLRFPSAKIEQVLKKAALLNCELV